MKTNHLLEELHQIIEEEKIRQRLSNRAIAEVIDYSDVGLAKALKKRTLKLQHIEMIAEHFSFFDRLEKFGIESNDNNLVKEASEGYNKIDIAKLSKLTRDNWEELLKDTEFSKHFEAILYKELSEKLAVILRERS